MVIALGAFAAMAFVLGMFPLEWAKNRANALGVAVPRIPRLTPEQSFGLGSIVIAIGVALLVSWH